MDIDKILEDYRRGDQGMRLRLFLAFRDLRDRFSEIEQQNPNDDLSLVKLPWSRKRRMPEAA